MIENIVLLTEDFVPKIPKSSFETNMEKNLQT